MAMGFSEDAKGASDEDRIWDIHVFRGKDHGFVSITF